MPKLFAPFASYMILAVVALGINACMSLKPQCETDKVLDRIAYDIGVWTDAADQLDPAHWDAHSKQWDRMRRQHGMDLTEARVKDAARPCRSLD
jgi:hypothetical protein